MRVVIFLISFFAQHAVIRAQTLYTARVQDFETKRPLDSVIVEVNGVQTLSNSRGFFQAVSKPGDELKAKRNQYVADSTALPEGDRFVYHLKREMTSTDSALAKPFYHYLAEKIKYPAAARSRRTEGTAFVYFETDVEGKITYYEDINLVPDGCSDQLEKLIRAAPRVWPRIKRFNKFILPVSFLIGGSDKRIQSQPPKDKTAVLLSEIVIVAYGTFITH